MSQLLLIPDPRPLVELLGLEFFREAPQCPGVYLMRDATETVLYVGKAKNLRKRLASYRVANPDRMPRRHLCLLRAVRRIELLECPDELSALARESELLRTLRPRFNRAGTWHGPPRFLAWKITKEGLETAVMQATQTGWLCHGPIGSSAHMLRAILVRLLWCAFYPERGLAGLPEGWFHGRLGELAIIPRAQRSPEDFTEVDGHLTALFSGCPGPFEKWIRERTVKQNHPFESAVREADLEILIEFASRPRRSTPK